MYSTSFLFIVCIHYIIGVSHPFCLATLGKTSCMSHYSCWFSYILLLHEITISYLLCIILWRSFSIQGCTINQILILSSIWTSYSVRKSRSGRQWRDPSWLFAGCDFRAFQQWLCRFNHKNSCLVSSKRAAVHYDQTSPLWSGLSKGHCSRSLVLCSDAALQT